VTGTANLPDGPPLAAAARPRPNQLILDEPHDLDLPVSRGNVSARPRFERRGHRGEALEPNPAAVSTGSGPSNAGPGRREERSGAGRPAVGFLPTVCGVGPVRGAS
jgi:hypothetical protein